jgi:hypothetical protein
MISSGWRGEKATFFELKMREIKVFKAFYCQTPKAIAFSPQRLRCTENAEYIDNCIADDIRSLLRSTR